MLMCFHTHHSTQTIFRYCDNLFSNLKKEKGKKAVLWVKKKKNGFRNLPTFQRSFWEIVFCICWRLSEPRQWNQGPLVDTQKSPNAFEIAVFEKQNCSTNKITVITFRQWKPSSDDVTPWFLARPLRYILFDSSRFSHCSACVKNGSQEWKRSTQSHGS